MFHKIVFVLKIKDVSDEVTLEFFQNYLTNQNKNSPKIS